MLVRIIAEAIGSPRDARTHTNSLTDGIAFAAVASVNGAGSISAWADELGADGFPNGKRLWGPNAVNRVYNYIRAPDCVSTGAKIYCVLIDDRMKTGVGLVAELKIPFENRYDEAIYVPINAGKWYPMSVR